MLKNKLTGLLLASGLAFTTGAMAEAKRSYSCSSHYNDYIGTTVNGDRWLKVELTLLGDIFPELVRDGWPRDPMGSAMALYGVVFSPVAVPIAAVHDLVVKIRRVIYSRHYGGIMLTAALQEGLNSVREVISLPSYPKSTQEVEEKFNASNVTETDIYKKFINSEPFLALTGSRGIGQEQYPSYVKKLLVAYLLGTEFCGPNSKPEFIPLLDLKL